MEMSTGRVSYKGLAYAAVANNNKQLARNRVFMMPGLNDVMEMKTRRLRSG